MGISFIIYNCGPGRVIRAGMSGNLIPGSGIFAHVQTGPGVHLASCTMGKEFFPGVNRTGRGADHPTPSSTEVPNEHSYTSTPLLGPSWRVRG
jgi:hypothetical protein